MNLIGETTVHGLLDGGTNHLLKFIRELLSKGELIGRKYRERGDREMKENG